MNNDYISHHGILGQKWGKKNGPPYPIGSGDHSAAEKKAGWQKSLKGSTKKKKKRLSEAEWNRQFDEEMKKSKLRSRPYVDENGTTYPPRKKLRDSLVKQVKGSMQNYRKLEESPEVKKAFDDLADAREEYRKEHKISEDYLKLSDDQLYDYKVRAYKELSEKWGGFGDFKIPPKGDKGSLDYGFLMYEDWDQGDGGSFDIFCRDLGSSADAEWDKHIRAHDKYSEAQKKFVNSWLGEYGNTKIKAAKYDEDPTIRGAVNAALDDMLYHDEWRRSYGVPV